MKGPKRKHYSRRRFLARAAAAATAGLAAPWIIPSAVLGGQSRPAPSERITLGFIGLGGQGIGRNLQMFLGQPDAEPVALCDVDRRRVQAALETVRRRRGEKATCFLTGDWREVIDRPEIDAVAISTPDQWHVPMSVAAVRAGKDVICEKPTLTIAEGRILADTVARYGAVFQTATEDRALPIYHRIAELVRNGRIGKLQRIFVQLPAGPGNPGDPRPKPLPEGLDWDMWLGPAPWKPYRQGLHMFHWRWNRDYSGGQLTDWGAHLIDTAQLANDTERSGPIEVEGVGKRHETGLYDTFFDYHLVYRYANGVVMHVDSGGTGIRFDKARSGRTRSTCPPHRANNATFSTVSRAGVTLIFRPRWAIAARPSHTSATLPWSWDANCAGTRTRKSSSATSRPIGCAPGPAGNHGLCNKLRRLDPRRMFGGLLIVGSPGLRPKRCTSAQARNAGSQTAGLRQTGNRL